MRIAVLYTDHLVLHEDEMLFELRLLRVKSVDLGLHHNIITRERWFINVKMQIIVHGRRLIHLRI